MFGADCRYDRAGGFGTVRHIAGAGIDEYDHFEPIPVRPGRGQLVTLFTSVDILAPKIASSIVLIVSNCLAVGSAQSCCFGVKMPSARV